MVVEPDNRRFPRPVAAERGLRCPGPVDHVGGVVPDLAAASATLDQAGFSLTFPASLMRPGRDRATMVESGGRQRCVMFKRGYVEIQQIEGNALDHPLAERVHRYQGLHVLALATADAAATAQRWASRGLSDGKLHRWGRPAGGAGGFAEFSFVVAHKAATPSALVIATEHHDPDLIRPAGSVEHPSRIEALHECLVSASDPGLATGTYAALTGVDPEDDGFGGRQFGDGQCSLTVGSPDWVRRRIPLDPVAPDCIAAAVLSVADATRFAGNVSSAGGIALGSRGGVEWFSLSEIGLVLGAVQGDRES